jgi:arylformamidase
MEIRDLSSVIREGMVVFPGDPGVSLEIRCTHEKNGCQVTGLNFGSHTGTHIDAPRHFLENGAPLTEVPLDSVVGEAICLEATLHKEDGTDHPVISLSQNDLDRINPGDRVILSTGWESKAGTSAYFKQYPIFDRDLVIALMGLQVRMIGIDLPTVEWTGNPLDPFEMHKAILACGMIPVEGLVNLKDLKGKRFFFSAAPMPLENGDGSPVRAYAIVDTDGEDSVDD